MNYTVKQMAEISGVSARTLRFYDERALLKPAFLSEAGYRMYTEKKLIDCSRFFCIDRWASH